MLAVVTDREVEGRLGLAEGAELRRQLSRMLRAVALSEERDGELELALRLTSDAVIAELNRDFRGIDRPTDVLAFAQREGEGPVHDEILGDLVISLETAARQKKKRGLLGEVLFLSAHGLCHLIGYDHQDDAGEREMNARMARLLAEGERRGRIRAA